MQIKRLFRNLSDLRLLLMLVLVSGVMLGAGYPPAFAYYLIDDVGLNSDPFVLRNGDVGWDGPGLGSAALNYYFASYTPDLLVAAQRTEMIRALNEWSKYVLISWTEVFTPGLDNTIDFDWYPGGHFSSSSVLAHAFYPDDVNSEPIAGDMHFNDDWTWRVGSDIDLFSVTLHELGHSLGLKHSDDSNAVMYPYYSGPVAGLAPDDIAGIKAIYAPIPEPASMLLLASGLVGLFGFRRRKGHGEME